jgi:hypothetical protein
MRESLTVSWAATDAMVVLMCAFTLRAPAHGTGGCLAWLSSTRIVIMF